MKGTETCRTVRRGGARQVAARWGALIALILGLCVAPSRADADPHAQYAAALSALQAGDYGKALDTAEVGLSEERLDKLLWVKAQALLKLGRLEQGWAILTLVRPGKLPADQQPVFVRVYEKTERQRKLRRAGKVHGDGDGGGGSAAGARKPAGQAGEGDAAKGAPDGVRQPVDATADVRAGVAPATAPARWPWLVGGAAVLGGGGLMALGLLTSSAAEDDLSSFATYADYVNAKTAAKQLYYAGLGLGAVGVGIAVWAATRPSPRAERRAALSVQPWLAGRGWGATALLRF